jgi:hypothetical protein
MTMRGTAMLARDYAPERIWQWGSLLDRRRCTPSPSERGECLSTKDLALLIAEINKNIAVLQRIRDFLDTTVQRELAASGKTPATALMMAGIIENYYTCLETLFLRISQNFENHLDAQNWRQILLDRMTLRIPGLRERVVSDTTKRDLGELLKFRYFKRYYFEIDYDWDLIDFLLKKIADVHSQLLEEIGEFVAFLERADGGSTR